MGNKDMKAQRKWKRERGRTRDRKWKRVEKEMKRSIESLSSTEGITKKCCGRPGKL